MSDQRQTPSILPMIGISAVIVIGVTFLIITLNTGDILWFWPVFNETPQRIVVHCYGVKTTLEPGTPDFDAVNEAVNNTLTGRNRWDELSMSNATYVEYQTSPSVVVLELSYNPPVGMHSMYKFFKNFNLLVIPLDGRHASTNTVFGRMNGQMIPGSMHPESTAGIADVLGEQGLCQIH